MDDARARALLTSERDEVRDLLKDAEDALRQDRESEADDGPRDVADTAQPLGAQGADEDIAGSLRDRLDAIERALCRLDAGTYGCSVRSGVPIPDERLEADPAAELTVEEARSRSSLRRTPRVICPRSASLPDLAGSDDHGSMGAWRNRSVTVAPLVTHVRPTE